MKYAIIGSGRQGTAAAHDLALFGDATEIRLLDADVEVASEAAARINRLVGRSVATSRGIDVRDGAALTGALQGIDAALSGVHYFLNVGAAKAAIAAGACFNDLGGNTDVVRAELELDKEARAAGVSIVPDCGLAPGMGNTLAVHAMDQFDRPIRARIFCGGLPQNPKPPLGYKLVFSLEGLTNEYTGEAIILRGGRRISEPAFTGKESIQVDGLGSLDAFYTSGGTSTCPWTLEGKIPDYEYKTLRYPGHYDQLKPLIDLGFLDTKPVKVGDIEVAPRQLAHRLLSRWIDFPDDPDLVVLRVDLTGEIDGRTRTLRQEIIDRQSAETGFTAMERTTAYPAAIVTILQARREVPAGAVPLESAVPGAAFVRELKRRDISLTETWLD
ncbi:MAG: saccharopine dehydrogenase C-terminal domain-containing protein [Candidatus Eisenbacteria bacterium]|nr:saccharopine dehydrogenase C-terminal domain-containing protein [Candidatus Eisenbacteria bacterium]